MVSSEVMMILLGCAAVTTFIWIAFLLEGVKEEEDRKDFVEDRMRSLREAEEKKRRRRSGESVYGLDK